MGNHKEQGYLALMEGENVRGINTEIGRSPKIDDRMQ
jgi:hypothetical protein